MSSTKHSHYEKERRPRRTQVEYATIPENLWRMKVVSINDFEYCSPPEGMVISRGDFVIASTRYGEDMARILGPVSVYNNIDADQIRGIIRMALEEDLADRAYFEKQEEVAYKTCQEKIDAYSLPMKLIDAHFVIDGRRLVFFFTAENRVDFRELVQDLARCFKANIELRQIGARDSARVIGGMAVCGRSYCCHGMTDKLSPVTIKMAKTQNLSLNSQKISGACGRLFCCLAYEHDHYVVEHKKLPPSDISIVYEGMNYVVSEVNALSQTVLLTSSDSKQVLLPSSRFTRRDGRWQLLPEDDVVE